MTSKELSEKVTKATEKVEKCKKTIERHQKNAEKKLALINKKGYSIENKQSYVSEKIYEAVDLIMEYELKLDDIQTAKQKLIESEKVLSNWKEKLTAQQKKDNMFAFVLPSFLIDLKEQLANEWTAQDIEKREEIKELRKVLSYKEYREKVSYSLENSILKDDDELLKANLKDAESWVLDLYNRVKAKIGDVISWKDIRFNGKALNGFVIGVNGTVEVETIVAGGYNVQRKHMRVLVK